MNKNLIFYTNPMSRGRVVQWILEEIGCAYHTEVLDFGAPMKTPEYLVINPMGKVPAIRHGGVVVTECAAICAYLADAYPESQLAPPVGDPLRGPYYRWLFFTAGPVEAASLNKELGVEENEKIRSFAGYGCYEDIANTLEQALSGRDYIVGDGFTAADLYLATNINSDMHCGLLEKRPVFVDYCQRLYSRSAAIRAKEIIRSLIQ